MAARQLARQTTAVPASFTCRLNRIENPPVARATAHVPVECLCDQAPIVRLSALDERRRADQNARNAEPALHAAFEQKGFAQPAARGVRESFDRRDAVTV